MKKRFIIFILLAACVVHAQTDDKETLKMLNQQVSSTYQNGKYDEALKYARQALDLSIKILGADSKDTAVAYTNLGIILRDKRKFKDSIQNLQSAVEIYQKESDKNKENIARVFDILVGVQYLSGNVEEAEKSGLEALKIREELYGRESKEVYLSNLSLAELYGRSKNKLKADEYYLKTYALAIKNFDKKSPEFEKIDESRVCSTAMITDSNKDFEEARQKLFGYEGSNDIVNGKALKLGRPAYPIEAKRAGANGAVVIKISIDEQGDPVEAKPICGHSLLRETSKEAALNSKFKPTLKDSNPVKVKGYIIYRYVL